MRIVKIWLLLLLFGINYTDLLAIKPFKVDVPSCLRNDFNNVVPQNTALTGLPLKVLGNSVESSLPAFIFISGDGGWNSFNESLCNSLYVRGINVVALDAQKYFWEIKSPAETTEALAKVIENYQKEWKQEKFVLAGYSFGSNIVPFVLNRFPAVLKKSMVLSILISPDQSCDFEIHLADMLNLGLSKGKYDVIKEIKSSDYKNFIAFFGSDESKSKQEAFQQAGIKVEILPGSHHFGSEYEKLADLIVNQMRNAR